MRTTCIYLHFPPQRPVALRSSNPNNPLQFLYSYPQVSLKITNVKDICTHMDIFLEEISRECTTLRSLKNIYRHALFIKIYLSYTAFALSGGGGGGARGQGGFKGPRGLQGAKGARR